MRALFPSREVVDRLGNLPPLPEIYPDQMAPIIRGADGGELEMVMARWGLPSPVQYHGKSGIDRGVTNVRNTDAPYWCRWLRPENRCIVPVDRFAEPAGKGLGNVWFEITDGRPAFFAGIHVPAWTSIRKLKDGETTDDLYGFLTTEPNEVVASVHPKAMPVVLADQAEWETWLEAPWIEARALQRPSTNGVPSAAAAAT